MAKSACHVGPPACISHDKELHRTAQFKQRRFPRDVQPMTSGMALLVCAHMSRCVTNQKAFGTFPFS